MSKKIAELGLACLILLLFVVNYFKYDCHPMEDVNTDDIVSVTISRRGIDKTIEDEKEILNIVTLLNTFEMRKSLFARAKENKSGEPVAKITLHYDDEDGEHDDVITIIDKRFIFNNKVYITKRSYFLDVFNMTKQLEVE